MSAIEERLQRLEESIESVHAKLDEILPKVQVMEDHVGVVERVAQRVPLVRRLLIAADDAPAPALLHGDDA